MSKNKALAYGNPLLDDIKKWALQALFSDDALLGELVLKGGNAMALVHRLSSRASIDLDFSMRHDFSEKLDAVAIRIEQSLIETFHANGYAVFDFNMAEKPDSISPELASFWGGYDIKFKLIGNKVFEAHRGSLETLRRQAIMIGQGSKFEIDISRFEYTEGKQEADVGGYRIYVYSPAMIVCEKLRAICQQMPEYGPIIKRDRPGGARARDFVDIHLLVTERNLDLLQDTEQTMLRQMFALKRVPLSFLGHMARYRDFHSADFRAVQNTVTAETQLKSFDFYFDFTLALVKRLEPIWNV